MAKQQGLLSYYYGESNDCIGILSMCWLAGESMHAEYIFLWW